MKDERLIKLQMKHKQRRGLAEWLKQPAVAAALTTGVLLVGLVAMPGVRTRVADQMTSAEIFLYGIVDDTDKGDQTKGKQGGGSTFKKIVTAPVRLVARIFRGGGSKSGNGDEVATKNIGNKDAADFKAMPVTRSTNGMPGETGESAAAGVEAASIAGAATKLFEEAVDLHSKGRVDAAIEKLSGSLTLDTNNAEAYNMLAVCYDEKGQYKQAQDQYKKALTVSQNNPRFLNNLGYSYYLSGDYANAVKWYSKGLKNTPDDKRLHNNIGLAYGRKGEFDKARQHFAIAVGELGANLNLGYVYSQHGKYDDAIRSYEAALQAQPSSLPALSNLAQLYERTGRLRESAALNEQYKKLAVTSQPREASVDR